MRGILTNGARIRELRKIQGHSQEQFAALVDCDVKTLRKAERGKHPVDLRIVVDIARVLGENFETLTRSGIESSSKQRLVEITCQFHDAFMRSDVASLLALHTEDTILELPGTDGLPAAQSCCGIEELRGHLEEMFCTFRLQSVRSDDFEIHAADNYAFLRSTLTIEYLPTGKTYTTRHMCELEFRDGKIARRITVADYELLRQIVADSAEEREQQV